MLTLLRLRPTLRLKVGRSSVHAEAVKHGSVSWAAEVSYDGPDDLADVIARLAAEAPGACPA